MKKLSNGEKIQFQHVLTSSEIISRADSLLQVLL